MIWCWLWWIYYVETPCLQGHGGISYHFLPLTHEGKNDRVSNVITVSTITHCNSQEAHNTPDMHKQMAFTACVFSRLKGTLRSLPAKVAPHVCAIEAPRSGRARDLPSHIFAEAPASFSLGGVSITFADISIKRAKVTQLYKPMLSILSLCYD